MALVLRGKRVRTDDLEEGGGGGRGGRERMKEGKERMNESVGVGGGISE